jgi:serine/threonine-protein kinase
MVARHASGSAGLPAKSGATLTKSSAYVLTSGRIHGRRLRSTASRTAPLTGRVSEWLGTEPIYYSLPSPASRSRSANRSGRTCYDSRRTEGVAALSLDESASFIAPSAFGPFRVLHQIGSGVLGPVFRTYEPQRDRLIAVKAFRLDLVPEDVARLADALRRLANASPAHPNLVPAVDAGLEGTTAYLAMDYVAGETLDVAFRHLAPAPLDRALPVLTQIADALEAGWAAGLGHGALHPRDAFLTAGANEVRVTGVGVVPALEATGVKAPVRRPYTAPERAAGESWDIRADVYSLGAIAHELLTRRRPAGSGEQDGALATGLSPEQRVHIRRILSAALAERPEHRFATPAAFATALTAVSRGETPVLPPEPEAAAPPAEKHGSARKRAAGAPLLDHLEPAALESQPQTPPPPAEPTVTAVIDLPIMPPVAASAPHTPVPDAPVALEPMDPAALSHFKSEEPAEPPPGPELTLREAAVAAPAPAAPAELPSVAAGPLGRPEPFSTRARSVPPPTFLAPEPETPSFPWAALAAGLLAGIALGGLGGYTIGKQQALPPVASQSTPQTTPPADTEVRVPPAPVTSPVPEPGARRAATPPPAAERTMSEPPKTTPAARPAATTGVAMIKSSPTGALVTIDGHPRGTTPATVRELSLGSHTLQVARPGYVPSSQSFALTEAQPSRELSVELQPAIESQGRSTARAGTIFVDTRPPGASVVIDGKSAGVTPVRVGSITPGSHAVRIELAGYRTIATSVDVKAGIETPLKVTLELIGTVAGGS